MSDEPTPRSTGKACVRNQGDRFEHSLPNERRSWCEHFRHAGATLRTFVSDNDDFPNLDLVAQDRLDDILLRIEDPSGPDEASLFDPRSFCNAAIGREIALENLEMPRRVHWIRPSTNHVLAAWGCPPQTPTPGQALRSMPSK